MFIGIRREDKNEWERRVPLIPEDLIEIKEKYKIDTLIQPSVIRCFPDNDYRSKGFTVVEDLSRANVVFAVKEIPIPFFRKGKTYVFFSHTIKGQPYNMPMLKKLMELECNLIDYEKITNEKGVRLIFFGNFAGYAGMIETLHILGQKLKLNGYSTPLEKIKQPYEYASVEDAKRKIKEVAEEIKKVGLPKKLCPVIIGFAGYGNVSKGAQEIFDILPNKIITPEILPTLHNSLTLDNSNFYKVVFKEEHLVKRIEGNFNLQEYFAHPEHYVSKFDTYIPYLSALVNCIYWDEKYPRLVTKKYLKDSMLTSGIKLQVIGDISCDVDGAVEITHKVTKPDNPAFTYFYDTEKFKDGIEREGITVMAVDNLPCEFPIESSASFSRVLKEFVPGIVNADFNSDFDELELPLPIKAALILHKGKLTKNYTYLTKFLNKEEK